MDECSLNTTSKDIKKHIFTWGDSQSFAFFPLVERYIELDPTISASLFSNNGVVSIFGVQGYEDSKNLFVQKIADYKTQHPDHQITVILMSHWMNYVGLRGIRRGLDAKNIKNSTECCTNYIDDEETYEGSLVKMKDKITLTINKLKTAGAKNVVIIAPYPQFNSDIQKCLNLRPLSSCRIVRKEFEFYRRDVMKLLEEVANSQIEVSIIDPVNYLCTADICPQFIKHEGHLMPVVFDDNHPSAFASKMIADKTFKLLK